MITIHRDALLLVPAIFAVSFMLWFLVMVWKDERRRRRSKGNPVKHIHLQDSIRSYETTKPPPYSGRQ